ncbi:unnamed protein product, partial [Musa hybrid cultivar]
LIVFVLGSISSPFSSGPISSPASKAFVAASVFPLSYLGSKAVRSSSDCRIRTSFKSSNYGSLLPPSLLSHKHQR